MPHCALNVSVIIYKLSLLSLFSAGARSTRIFLSVLNSKKKYADFPQVTVGALVCFSVLIAPYIVLQNIGNDFYFCIAFLKRQTVFVTGLCTV